MADPAPFPEDWFASVSFDLRRFTYQNMLRGGLTQTGEAAEARWVGKFTTGQIEDRGARLWRGWWDSLRGGLRSFIAYDPAQEYPFLYPDGPSLTRSGGGAFDWTATVTAIDTTNAVLGIGGGSGKLPAAFSVVPGDMVGLIEGTKYGLFRIVQAASASGAGNIGFTVEPRIMPGLFTTAAVAHFYRPSCLMTPDPSSWAYTAQGDPSPVSFAGIQVIF